MLAKVYSCALVGLEGAKGNQAGVGACSRDLICREGDAWDLTGRSRW
jgi:hypothetical protein